MTATFTWKNPVINTMLVVAAFLSAALILFSEYHRPVAVDATANLPDFYMEDVTATMMTKAGTPTLKIQSPKMTHYAENDTTYMTKPHVTIYRQSPQPWYVDSDTGKAVNGIEHIIFSDNVVIHHPSDPANPTTIMKTTSLNVFPDKQQAETNDAVVITQPDTVVHAIGMLANLEDGTIKLLSQAKGDYVPSS